MDATRNGRSQVVSVPIMVRHALDRCSEQFELARRMAHRTHGENVARSERLAVLCDRESRWFGVLHRWAYSPQSTVPIVFGQAAIKAESCAMSDARFWAENAAYYRARLVGIDHDQAENEAWSR